MITAVDIENLRGIARGKLEGLAPLTILTGPNGCGKSTVLDALLIGGSSELGHAVGHTVRRRPETRDGARWLVRRGASRPRPAMIQHVILCEGYDDRAFWAGWLLHTGLRDLSLRPGTRSRQQVKDPWGLPRKPGTYGYATPSDAFVRLVSCDGGENVPRAAEQFLKGRATHPVGHLLINLDADDTLAAPSTRAEETVRGVARKAHGSELADATGAYAVDDVRVRPVIWRCPDGDAPGLPAQQTLERRVPTRVWPPR